MTSKPDPLGLRHALLGCVLLVALCSARAAQRYEPAQFADAARAAKIQAVLPKLDEIYRAFAAAHHLPGMVYGVVLDDQLLHTGTTGVADRDTQAPAASNTRFRIASMSKSFTAMAVLKLRDRGRLNLDDPVARYIPAFRRSEPLAADSPPITIRHLLVMLGGLPQDDPWGDRLLDQAPADFKELVRREFTFSNPPGQVWEYSNLGYALLGEIVSRAARMPYQRYISREILEPLGMRDTVWEYSAVPPAKLARGYRWEHEAWRPEPILHDGAFGAMGGLISSLDDFARYVAFHLSAWPPRAGADRGPVRRATLREMHRPGAVIRVVPDPRPLSSTNNPYVMGYSYGLSWNMDARGVVWVRHSGGLPGFGSEYRFLPDYGLGLIAFANRTYAPMYQINTRAMELLLTEASLEPRLLPPSPILLERQRQLSQLIQTWEPRLEAEALADNFFLDKDRSGWMQDTKALLAKAGAVVEVGSITPQNQLRGTFQIRCQNGALEVFFTLTPERIPKIQALSIRIVESRPAAP